MKKAKTLNWIIWDWNGTLLDDVELCVKALNVLCEKRGIPYVSIEEYKKHFTFPVVNYYKSVGFNFEKEPFDIPASEWLAFYAERILHDAKLFPGVKSVLEWCSAMGFQQVILSAHEQNMLENLLIHYQIRRYFHSVWAVDDYMAHGKSEIAKKMIDTLGITPASGVVIGDTLHDYEVAQNTELYCILISAGHQDKERLQTVSVPILENILEVPKYLGNHLNFI